MTFSACRDALSQLLGPVKLHLEELVIERCSDFLSWGTLHFSPLAAVSRLRVGNPVVQVADLSEPANTSAAKHACLGRKLIKAVTVAFACFVAACYICIAYHVNMIV